MNNAEVLFQGNLQVVSGTARHSIHPLVFVAFAVEFAWHIDILDVPGLYATVAANLAVYGKFQRLWQAVIFVLPTEQE